MPARPTESPTSETLADLLRGELSAVETYERALDRVRGAPQGALLRRIHGDHSQAVGLLRDVLMRYAGELPTCSDAWHNFADPVRTTEDPCRDPAALRSLRAGEEHGIREYQRALEDPGLGDDVGALSRGLQDRCRAHVQELDALLQRR